MALDLLIESCMQTKPLVQFDNSGLKSSSSFNLENDQSLAELFQMFCLYRKQGELAQAEQILRQLLKVRNILGFRLTLIYLKIKGKTYHQASVLIDNQRDFYSHINNIRYLLSTKKIECHLKVKEYEKCLDIIQSIDSVYRDEILLNWHGLVLVKLDRINEGEQMFKHAMEFSLENEFTWLGLGTIHYLKGDRDLGKGCFSRALDFSLRQENLQEFMQDYFL